MGGHSQGSNHPRPLSLNSPAPIAAHPRIPRTYSSGNGHGNGNGNGIGSNNILYSAQLLFQNVTTRLNSIQQQQQPHGQQLNNHNKNSSSSISSSSNMMARIRLNSSTALHVLAASLMTFCLATLLVFHAVHNHHHDHNTHGGNPPTPVLRNTATSSGEQTVMFHPMSKESFLQANNNLPVSVKCPTDKIEMLPNLNESSSSTSMSSSNENVNTLCGRLGTGQTTASLWRRYLTRILTASIHPYDETWEHTAWMAELIYLMKPIHLARGHKGSSVSIKQTERLLQIVQRKMAAPNDPTVPALQIAVLGGSVTEGTRCEVKPALLKAWLQDDVMRGMNNMTDRIFGATCAWPSRLQRLADEFLGPGVIQIYNLGVGGTNSDLAIPILKYRLYPRTRVNAEHEEEQLDTLRLTGPDIIVNAYGVNDNLFGGDDVKQDVHWEFLDQALNTAQTFYRSAVHSRPCQDPPVVVFVNEYMGNQNEMVLGEEIRHMAVQLLSDYYHFPYISYSHAVRPYVFANDEDHLLSPKWYKGNRRRVYKNLQDGHFLMPGHVLLPWVVAYGILQDVVQYCDAVADDELYGTTTLPGRNMTLAATAPLIPPEVMRRAEEILPPILDRNLTLTNIMEEWIGQADALEKAEQAYCESAAANKLLCPFAFLATPVGTHKDDTAINDYIRQYAVENKGWKGKNDIRNGWQNKLGFVTSTANSSFHLKLEQLEQPVRYITLQTLKSYGPDWDTVVAEFRLTVQKANTSDVLHEHVFNITGYHDSNTSIAYSYEFDWGETVAADSLHNDVHFTTQLVSGQNFKIIAILLCSR